MIFRDSVVTQFSSFWLGCGFCDGELEDSQHMLVNSGALAFAAAGDIQNAVERLQRDSQEFCVSLDIREVTKPDVPLCEPSALIQCEPTAWAQRGSGKNHREAGLLYVLNGARLIRVLRVLLQWIARGHNTVFGAATFGAPTANWNADGETKIESGSVGAGLPSRDDFSDVQTWSLSGVSAGARMEFTRELLQRRL
jgi:hypothetical protein